LLESHSFIARSVPAGSLKEVKIMLTSLRIWRGAGGEGGVYLRLGFQR